MRLCRLCRVSAVIFIMSPLRPFRNHRVPTQNLHLTFLFIMTRSKRKANAADSAAGRRKKGKLSSKRLISMINSNKGVDVGLESNEKIDVDSIDLRTGRDRGALLLWVCFLNRSSLLLWLMRLGRR